MSTKNAKSSNTTNEEPTKGAPKKGSGLSTNQKIMIGGFTALIIVIVAVAVIIVSVLNKPERAPLPTGGNLIINEDNLAQITEEIKANVEDGMFMTDMNIDWSFPSGKSTSTNAHVGNMANNRHPLSFDLINSATGEVIYTSDVIPVGYSIKEITLDTDLTAGTYPMVCNYRILNEETGEAINTLSINVTVRILN